MVPRHGKGYMSSSRNPSEEVSYCGVTWRETAKKPKLHDGARGRISSSSENFDTLLKLDLKLCMRVQKCCTHLPMYYVIGFTRLTRKTAFFSFFWAIWLAEKGGPPRVCRPNSEFAKVNLGVDWLKMPDFLKVSRQLSGQGEPWYRRIREGVSTPVVPLSRVSDTFLGQNLQKIDFFVWRHLIFLY